MKIRVQKYNPQTDAKPYYVTGEVPFTDKMTGLHALMRFDEDVEHVNYDHSCRSRVCGRCAMNLNGVPTLICVERLEDRDYTFEPLAGFPVERDLIVDKHALDDKISGISQRIRVEPFDSETIKAPAAYMESDMWTEYALDYCCRCGCCTAACPSYPMNAEEFIGPSAMIAVAYRHFDPLDQGDRVLEAVSGGLYHCIMCGKCDDVCKQQEIDHLGIWKRLREEAEKRGIKPSYA
jgi:succinate dehydrogenase/fumarate reductase iron-sulfur protein